MKVLTIIVVLFGLQACAGWSESEMTPLQQQQYLMYQQQLSKPWAKTSTTCTSQLIGSYVSTTCY